MMSAAPQRASAAEAADGHWLSFDVEEYFQVEAAAARVSRHDWPQFASRVEPCVDRILELLAGRGARATFFVLGWVARRHGVLVRRIAAQGHEIASHGMTHRMASRLSPAGLRREVEDSRRLLEDSAGQAVEGFRAPTFSVTRRTGWVIDVLAAARYRYDSSVYPVRHDRYGVPEAPRGPHRAVGPDGGTLIELPPLTCRVLGTNVPVGGGGYLRLLPVRVVGRALRAWGRRNGPGMLYLHPWELDPDQPSLPMSRLGRMRHRVGLRRTEGKLAWLLEHFRFREVRSSVARLEAARLPTFRYG